MSLRPMHSYKRAQNVVFIVVSIEIVQKFPNKADVWTHLLVKCIHNMIRNTDSVKNNVIYLYFKPTLSEPRRVQT